MYTKKEAAPCSLKGAVAASFKLEQNYFLTQFSLQTHYHQTQLPHFSFCTLPHWPHSIV
jgi:hypothetical protein